VIEECGWTGSPRAVAMKPEENPMTLSIYSASVPVFQQMLRSLDGLLSKAEAQAEAGKFDESAFLQARLFPDMFPLLRQVQIAADFAKSVSARLAGEEPPSYEDNETSFVELHARIARTQAYIAGLDPAKFEGAQKREIVLRPGTPKERRFNGQAYLLHYGLPQFFFHVTTAYALLRHNGVAVGKLDYMGAS
jgi:hypothetical protein